MLQSPTEQEYIQRVEALFHRHASATGIIEALGLVDLPRYPSEIVELISALPADLEWDRDQTYDYLRGVELTKALEATSQQLLEKLQRYLQDYGAGNEYHTDYRLFAKYRGLHHHAYDWEQLEKTIDAKTLNEATQLATTWKTELNERIRLGKTADEFKLDSINVEVRIVDSGNNLISSSAIKTFEDK